MKETWQSIAVQLSAMCDWNVNSNWRYLGTKTMLYQRYCVCL